LTELHHLHLDFGVLDSVPETSPQEDAIVTETT
jgi:hypothetical protein